MKLPHGKTFRGVQNAKKQRNKEGKKEGKQKESKNSEKREEGKKEKRKEKFIYQPASIMALGYIS